MGASEDFLRDGLGPGVGQAFTSEGDFLAVEVDLSGLDVSR
jgi:hypothetical protein